MTQENTNLETSKEYAREFLVGNLIKASTRRFKSLKTPFSELNQVEQELHLRQMADDIKAAVQEAVEIISSDYRMTFRASCDKVEFKSGGVKAVLSAISGEQAHALADVAGGNILIVIEDASRYLDEGDATQGDADQPPLFDQIQAAKEL